MRKKVLFVINTLGHAGAETALLELLANMDPGKYEVFLYVLMGQGELLKRLPAHVKLLNKEYSNASVLSEDGKANMRRTVMKAAMHKGNVLRLMPYLMKNAIERMRHGKLYVDKLLWRVLSDGAPKIPMTFDLAVAYLEGGSAYYVADHVKAVKKAAFIHIDYSRAGYTRELDQNCYLRYDRIFTVSKEVKEHFLRAYPECVPFTEVFHNLINQETIRSRAKEAGGFTDDYDGIRLLTVGRLTSQKAYEIAIEAMALLKQDGYKARWYILGEGKLRRELEEQIRRRCLEEDFILLGADGNPFPYYKQCDIYVHATRFEGKSIAIQEAQTLGCAIIASDCSGNREQIIQNVDGVLCPLTPEGIRDSIEYYIDNPQIRTEFGNKAVQKEIVHREELQMLLQLLGEEK